MEAPQSANECNVTDVKEDPHDALYQRLKELRDHALEVMDHFIRSSTLYYTLTAAMDDVEAAPMAQLTLDIPIGGEPMMTFPWPLVENGQIVEATAMPLLAMAARSYRESWLRLKNVTDEAMTVTAQLAALAEEPAPMPEGAPLPG
jgi:hypothetical protein